MPAVPFEKQGRCSGNFRCTNISPCAGSLLCTRKSWLRYTWGLTEPLFLPCHYLTYWRNSLSMIVLLIRKFPGLQWLNILDLHASHFKSFGTGQGSFSSKLINHCFFTAFLSPFPGDQTLVTRTRCHCCSALVLGAASCSFCWAGTRSLCCVQLLPSPGLTETHFGPEKAEAEPVRSGVII